MAAELSVIIVNWNGGDLLRRAVESVVASAPPTDYEVVVVDNASTDDSLARLRGGEVARRAGAARLRIIENSENLGFSKANNQAIAATDAPLVFLLNSDTEVRPGAIDALVATLRSEARIGAVGPRLIGSNGKPQPSVSRNPPAAWYILLTGFRLHRLLPKRLRGELLLAEHWDYARRREVRFLSGAAILAKREMIAEVGGLEERFHMYGEDIEWCLRIVRSGWRLVFEPAAEVVHYGGQSAGKRWDNSERILREVDGNLRFQKHCLPRWRVASNILASSLVVSTAHAWRGLRGRPMIETRGMLDLHLRHLKHLFAGGRRGVGAGEASEGKRNGENLPRVS